MKEQRKCIYDGKEYIFHEFYMKCDVIGESLMLGGHPSGQLSFHMAVLENEEGKIIHVPSQQIQFLVKL